MVGVLVCGESRQGDCFVPLGTTTLSLENIFCKLNGVVPVIKDSAVKATEHDMFWRSFCCSVYKLNAELYYFYFGT